MRGSDGIEEWIQVLLMKALSLINRASATVLSRKRHVDFIAYEEATAALILQRLRDGEEDA